MAAALCNSSRQERERERKKEKEEGEVDRAEGDKVKPPDGLNPDRMRQMTCVNGGRYRSESFRAPEQKKKTKQSSLSLELFWNVFRVARSPIFFLLFFFESKVIIFFFFKIRQNQGHFNNSAPELLGRNKTKKSLSHFGNLVSLSLSLSRNTYVLNIYEGRRK
jgi:hypothetical protein